MSVLLVAGLVLAGCGRTAETSTTLEPLVPVEELPVQTAAPSTTEARREPARPIVPSLPEEVECLLAPPVASGEITFVSGDRLFGVTPDGSGVRCLAIVSGETRGPVRWSPTGERATLGWSTVLSTDGSRSSGYNSDNTRVVWEHPLGEALLGPTATSRTLVRRTVDAERTRTEPTFLGRTDVAISHPGGGMLIGAGFAWDYGDGVDGDGLVAADETGQNRVQLLRFDDENSRVTELAVDGDGRTLWFVATVGDSFLVQRLGLVDRVMTEVVREQEPVLQLTTGPGVGTAAWKVGLCNSTTETRVLDGRDGSIVVVGEGTQLDGSSVSPVGWLDAARLVVVARPLGCDGPGDIWVWNQLDGSATLVTQTVEFVSVRTIAPAVAPVRLDPALPVRTL